MKYKVGDKVRVREDLVAEKQYGKDFFVSGMVSFKGKVVTISNIESGFYALKEDSGRWSWTEEMFLPIVTKYKIGDKVIVREDLLEYEKYKDILFIPSMSSFKGKIVTIYDITDRGYRIEEDSKRYHWTDDMFSGKVSQDFISKESASQSTLSKEESSYDIITVKTTKLKLLLL